MIEDDDSTNRLQRLVFDRKEEIDLELDTQVESQLSQVPPEEERSLTMSELQSLISDGDGTERSALRLGAIRTIRGSRMGVVPIRTRSK